MFWQLLKGLQFLHVVLLVLGAIGFFVFWARTRFWLPRYAHTLAFIGLVVGVWSASILPNDGPQKVGLIGRGLFALVFPAIVYFFFIFSGGQRAAFGTRFQTTTRCPHCNSTVTTLQTDGSLSDPDMQRCARCGFLVK